VICATLFMKVEERHSLHYALSTFTDGTGYNFLPISFLLGFTSVTYTLTDYDGATHLSEETHRPAHLNPIAITTAITSSAILGLLLTTTFTLHLTSLPASLASPLNNPIAYLLSTKLSLPLALALWTLIILIQLFTGISALLADTRMCYAFARDHGLPFSSYLAHVNPITHTPLRAVWGTVGCCFLLLMVGVASEDGMVTVFNLTAPALDLSYAAVIAARWWYRNEVEFVAGPWTLGKYGFAVNAVAVGWVVGISGVLFLPVRWPITWGNMNYAPVVAATMAGVSLAWWYAGANR
jgi:amino acid transporter